MTTDYKQIILIILFILFILKFYTFYKVNDFPTVTNNKHSFFPEFALGSRSVKKIKNTKINTSLHTFLKTGDLLFISYINDILKYNFVKFFCGSVFTHCSIFYKDPITKEGYVLEAAIYRSPYCNNFIKIPFQKWLCINRNQRIAVLPINKELDATKLLNVQQSLKYKLNRGYYTQDLSWNWIRFIFKRKKEHYKTPENTWLRSSGGIVCSEYIVEIYQSLGVYSNEYHSSSFHPASLFRKEIETVNGYSFGEAYPLNCFENNYKIPY